jgi:hypothetical protein
VTSVTSSPVRVPRGGQATLRAVATDPDSDSVTYDWAAVAGGTLSAATGQQVTWTAPATAGSYLIAVLCDDGKGGCAAGAVTVEVGNEAPTIATITASPMMVARGAATTLRASVSDPEGGPVTCAWSAPSGYLSAPTGTQVTWTAPTTDGSYVITLTATDASGATSTGTVSVLVVTPGNRAPVIATVTASPIAMVQGGTTTLRASVSDPDDDPVTCIWSAPSGTLSATTGTQVTWTAPTMDGSFLITLVATDDKGGVNAGTVAVLVATPGNEHPTISSISADPIAASPGGSTTLTVHTDDPDQDPVTCAWSCAAGSLTPATGTYVTWTAPTTPGSYVISVEASDGHGSVVGEVAVLVTSPANNPPVISAIAPVTGTNCTGGAAVACTITATDQDGDALACSWSATGGSFADMGSSSPPTYSTTWTAPAQAGTYTITAIVADGHGGLMQRSANVTVTKANIIIW